MKRKSAYRGFAPTPTQRFTAEIFSRNMLNGEEEPMETYQFKVAHPPAARYCPPGETPESMAIRNAVALVHVRLHDLYWRAKFHPSPIAIDAFLWRNTTEGMPLIRMSSHPFEGSHKAKISDDDPSAPMTPETLREIVARERTSMIRRLS